MWIHNRSKTHHGGETVPKTEASPGPGKGAHRVVRGHWVSGGHLPFSTYHLSYSPSDTDVVSVVPGDKVVARGSLSVLPEVSATPEVT